MAIAAARALPAVLYALDPSRAVVRFRRRDSERVLRVLRPCVRPTASPRRVHEAAARRRCYIALFPREFAIWQADHIHSYYSA